jgi:hypothetical protein
MHRIPMSTADEDGQLPDDLLAPEDEETEPERDDAPGIEGEEHLGLTPPD